MNRGGIPALTDCAFTNNRGHGVWFTDHAMGELVRCRVLGSHGVGMLIETQSNPAIKHCTISGSRESGVLTARGGLGSFVGCTFAHNKPVGVTVGEGSNPVVFKSEFEANAPYHVLIMDGALGHVHGNRMTAVDRACIVLGGGARCIVADNEMLLGHDPSGRAVGPAVSTPQQQEHRGSKVDESGAGQDGAGARKEEKTGRTKRADAKKEAAVAVCWSDSEGLVRGINPMDLQRLALGFSYSSTSANARTLAGARAHTHTRTHAHTHTRQARRTSRCRQWSSAWSTTRTWSSASSSPPLARKNLLSRNLPHSKRDKRIAIVPSRPQAKCMQCLGPDQTQPVLRQSKWTRSWPQNRHMGIRTGLPESSARPPRCPRVRRRLSPWFACMFVSSLHAAFFGGVDARQRSALSHADIRTCTHVPRTTKRQWPR